MSRGFRRFGLALAAAVALGTGSAAFADSDHRTRVTIRGTGSNVTIDRTPVPARPRPAAARLATNDLLDRIERQKAAGAPDSRVLADLRARQFELPLVLSSRDLLRLRQLGAGDSVISYLSHVSAVDIGETSDDNRSALAPPPAPEPSASFYDQPYLYAAGGWPAAYGRARFHAIRRFPSHPMAPHHPMTHSRRQPW